MGKVTLKISKMFKSKMGILVIVFSLLFANPSAIFATSLPEGDLWYTAIISIKPETLPKEVKFIVPKKEQDTYYLLKNDSPTPLYIIDTGSIPGKFYPASELPVGIKPIYKLTRVDLYYYQGAGQNTSNITDEWVSNQSPYLSLSENELSGWGVIEYRNIRADNRPPLARVPSSQGFKLAAYHGDKPITIEGTVSYQLNDKYDPQLRARSARMPDPMTGSIPVGAASNPLRVVILLAGIVLIIYFLIKRFRK